MNNIQQAYVWLRRIGHCRGFGIQSPTDYRFVRSVVNERSPYYAYETLECSTDLLQRMGLGWLQGERRLERKLRRLYLRLANWLQPRVIVSETALDYLHAGCRTARVCEDADKADLLVISPLSSIAMVSPIATAEEQAAAVFSKATEHTVIVIDKLWQQLPLWQRLVADERARIAFDLYYCGILMLDKQRDRQYYIVNF